MIVLGVILLALGALFAYLGRGERVAQGVGVVFAVAGAVLLIIGVLDLADAQAHASAAAKYWGAVQAFAALLRSSWGAILAGWPL